MKTSLEASCGMASLSVDDMVRHLGDAYVALLRNKAPLRLMPSVMLWGPPGLGKSQGVRQLADYVGSRAKKTTELRDVRLLLFNPVDLRGIPVANAERTLAVWLKPKIFDMDTSENILNFLFLDEISAAPPSVQAAAYQITLDRTVGEHKLPDNCIVIAAGNRVTDRSVAWQMPLALANRLCHIELECDFRSWRRWAVAGNIHGSILGWLARRPNQLMGFNPGNDALAFPSPRTWEMASHLLNNVSGDPETIQPLLAGCLGAAAAAEFCAFCRGYGKIPPMEDVFAGRCRIIPEAPDALYALISSMLAFARPRTHDLVAMGHSIRYALSLPPDFTFALMRDYMALEEKYRDKLLAVPEFCEWLRRNERLL
jgi:hypothetical protein